MGVWSYKPFGNDYILDYCGGFHNTERVIGLIEEGIHMSEHFYGCYEMCALLISTFKGTDVSLQYATTEERAKEIMKFIGNKAVTSDETFKLCESVNLWLSACSIAIDKRKELLQEASKALYKLINTNKVNDEQSKYWFLITTLPLTSINPHLPFNKTAARP